MAGRVQSGKNIGFGHFGTVKLRITANFILLIFIIAFSPGIA
jgi:hypothetical protein